MNNESKPLVLVFSDPNFLAVNILETLLSKNCIVVVVTDDKDGWLEMTTHIASLARFSFIGFEEYKKISNFTYAIFCGGFLKKENAITDFKKFIFNKNFGNAKTLAILPFEIFSFRTSNEIAISGNAGIIYVGDLMGPKVDLKSNLLLPSLVNQMVSKHTLTLGVGEIFYPVLVSDVAKAIVKWLLSFGPYGKESFLLGKQLSSSDFWKQNQKSFLDLKVLYDIKIKTRLVPKGYEMVYINSNLNVCFNETYKWIIEKKSSAIEKKPQIKKTTKVKVDKTVKLKFLKPFLLPSLIVLIFPLITSILSCGFLFLAYRQFLTENINNAENLALLAKTVFTIGKEESDVLSYFPLLGRVYKETSYISEAGRTLSDISYNLVPFAENGRQILGNILGDELYDVKIPSTQMKSDLDTIFQEIYNFQVKTQKAANSNVLSAQKALQIVDFTKLENLSQQGELLSASLPSILGQDTDKNYLILFENNMELRPTGGFIGSYGVANFGGGKMNGLEINDIYSADGQLKGHVEPPSPIKNYLGEANWWFRDSNWDPDFPTSSQRAEWFLNKEMGQTVDGVIAVDLEPIKDILTYTGPIFLPDYNLTITADNLYEKTQEEAQADSFAGSRQKASFLTALSRSLIAKIPKMNSKNRMLVLKAFYESLVGRHLQIYLHNDNVASALDKLGWDGKVKTYTCGESCYSDFFGDVEANVGVNKSNYFVKRKLNFKTNIDSQHITRNLTLSLTNSANPSLGLSGIYKSYIRIMIPSDAKVISIKSIIGKNETILQPEITNESGRQEVGVLIEVNPQESTDINFEWQNNIPNGEIISNYGLYVRKQAGVNADSLSVQFTGIGKIDSSPKFSLTAGGVYTYNTTLDQDFFSRISWK